MIVVPVEKKVDWTRPPIVLILLVVANILVFAFYQSGDDELYNDAFTRYHQLHLLDKEWPAYKAYVRRADREAKPDKNKPEIVGVIISDSGFDSFLNKNYRRYIKSSDLKSWRKGRSEIDALIGETSTRVLGLDANNIQPLQLITYQFLHGDVMHIVGNLVFLILTGFAVEAALGSLRFLGFYLLSGIGSALFYSLFISGSSGYLVGASGSISGVMAMYVVLFGLRKIQFFYWFLIFTGYFRAAAIVMLPVYIVFEIYNYVTNDGSNVAYTAHIGGFLVGAFLVFLTKSVNKSGIDDVYIEGEEVIVDPFSESLQKIYQTMAQCEFKRAWSLLKTLKQKSPNRPELVDVEYNLVRALHPKKITDYLTHRLDKPNNSKKLVLAQVQAWQKFSVEEQQTLSFQKKIGLLQNALNYDCLDVAEKIFNDLKRDSSRHIDLAVPARRLAVFCQEAFMQDKSAQYNKLATTFAGGRRVGAGGHE